MRNPEIHMEERVTVSYEFSTPVFDLNDTKPLFVHASQRLYNYKVVTNTTGDINVYLVDIL